MNISTILELIASSVPNRVAVSDTTQQFTYAQVDAASSQLAQRITESRYEQVSWLATNSALFPIMVFACAKAGVPFVPLNYRLADEMLQRQGQRLGNALLIADPLSSGRLNGLENLEEVLTHELLTEISSDPTRHIASEVAITDPAAVWLFTSGTTGPPKISILQHDHLSSYILGTIELCSADKDESILVSVPPYHIAGLASVLSSFFAGRRMAYLENFDPAAWVKTAEQERITQAMVVPTMLERILQILEYPDAPKLKNFRNLSYGGGRMPLETIRKAMTMLPHIDYANAYGLTETSSTITILGPEDHREAFHSDDPLVSRRIGSVGKPVPGVELEVRTLSGELAAPGEVGEVYVRGPQISGQYLGQQARDADAWFATRDSGELDEEGFLYLHGRVDEVIVRGGENISPGEIEDVLRTHYGIIDVTVTSEPDAQWGEVPVALLVVDTTINPTDEQLSALVRQRLRSSRIPARYVRVDALPYNELGKVIRQQVRALVDGMATVDK